MCPQNLKTVHYFHPPAIDEDGQGSVFLFLESRTSSFVFFALSERLLMEHHSVRFWTNYCRIICEFDDGVGGVDWCAVMGVKTIQKWAQHTALGGTDAESESGGGVGGKLDGLRAVGKTVIQEQR